MPGVEETSDDLMIFFWTGERDSLNNAKVGAPLNVVRDIGFTIFNPSGGAIVTKDKNSDAVDADASGGYYGTDDASTWNPMANSGNAWITNYKDELTSNGDF